MSKGSPDWDLATIADYWDAVAPRYLELFRDEFDEKPFDKFVISAFAARLPAGARVLDAGCGPCGHVARLLADKGLDVTGIDISPACIALSRMEAPALRFDVMDMAATVFADGSFDGLIAYYALHYHPRDHLPGIMREFARMLRPGGQLLIVAKEGNDEGWIGDPMKVAGQVFWSAWPADDLQSLAAENGFADIHCDARAPLTQEIAVRRIYLTAVRSGT